MSKSRVGKKQSESLAIVASKLTRRRNLLGHHVSALKRMINPSSRHYYFDRYRAELVEELLVEITGDIRDLLRQVNDIRGISKDFVREVREEDKRRFAEGGNE